MYNHDGDWYTIRTRGDIFSAEKLDRAGIDIPPSHIEVYKGIVHVGYIKYVKREARYIESWRNMLTELIRVLPNAMGYGDRALREYMAWWTTRINQLTRALESRNVELAEFKERLTEAIKTATEKLERKDEKKLRILKNALGELTILQDTKTREKRKAKPAAKKAKKNRGNRKIGRRRKELVYRGPASNAPTHAKTVLKLLKKVFKNRHITSSKIEGLIGVYVHNLRNSRGKGKILRKLGHMRKPVWTNFKEISNHLQLGRGPRDGKPRLRKGKTYTITYEDKHGNTTTRKIEVLEVKKKHIKAYCHLRKQVRTFRKSRITSIKPA